MCSFILPVGLDDFVFTSSNTLLNTILPPSWILSRKYSVLFPIFLDALYLLKFCIVVPLTPRPALSSASYLVISLVFVLNAHSCIEPTINSGLTDVR